MTADVFLRTDFASVAELCEEAERPALPGARVGDTARELRGGRHGADWYMMEDLPAAINAARFGWPEGLHAFMVAGDEFRQFAPAGAPAVMYDVGGARPDVQRYLAGDMAHMITPGAAEMAKPVITLWLQKLVSAMVDARNVHNQGLAILAHIDAAEAAGYRVEVNCIWRGKGLFDGRVYERRWPVKAAEQHVDLDRLAFMLANTDVQRRLLFAADAADPAWRACWSGANPAPRPDLGPNSVYFTQPADACWSTPEGAMAKVAEMIAAGTCIAADDPLLHWRR